MRHASFYIVLLTLTSCGSHSHPEGSKEDEPSESGAMFASVLETPAHADAKLSTSNDDDEIAPSTPAQDTPPRRSLLSGSRLKAISHRGADGSQYVAPSFIDSVTNATCDLQLATDLTTRCLPIVEASHKTKTYGDAGCKNAAIGQYERDPQQIYPFYVRVPEVNTTAGPLMSVYLATSAVAVDKLFVLDANGACVAYKKPVFEYFEYHLTTGALSPNNFVQFTD